MRRRRLVRAAMLCSAVGLLVPTAAASPAEAREGTAQAVPGMRWLAGIWCAFNGACLGVGFTPENVGAVVTLRADGSIGPVRTVPETTTLWQITCMPRGGCIAVGEGGGGGVVVEVSRDGIPGAVRAVPGTAELLDVACPTAVTCVATGRRLTPTSTDAYLTSFPAFVVITDGQPAPTQPFPRGTQRAIGIACPTRTTCLAVASTGFVVLTDVGGTWSPTLHRVSSATGSGYPTDEISCPSSTQCYATAAGFISSGSGYTGVPAVMSVSSEGVAGPVHLLSNRPGSTYDISCHSGGTCTVVGQDSSTSQGLVIDLIRGAPATTWANSNFFTSVSCVAAATCGIVGNTPTGAVFGWHGPVPGW